MSTITVKLPKPRAKRLHSILLTKKGGRMRSPRDYDRAALKRETREEVQTR